MQVSITVWDDAAVPQGSRHGTVYTWNGYAATDSVRSLLGYVEANADRLRARYLAWVHDFGETMVNGRSIVEHLMGKDGFSYWRMTSVREKSPLNPRGTLTDAIRLFAVQEILREQKPHTLRLVSANPQLHAVMRDMARNMGIAFEGGAGGSKVREFADRWLLRPALKVKALAALARYAWLRLPLRRLPRTQWKGGKEAVFFCTYFANVDASSAARGIFVSRYWEDLHARLHRLGRQPNWLLLFVPHQAIPTARRAQRLVQRFNSGPERDAHAFVDAYLRGPVLWRVFSDWLRLARSPLGGEEIAPAFVPSDAHFSLWPILRHDWLVSLQGPAAINSLMHLHLFDQALGELPHQKDGFYVCENQPWEQALIRAWRKHGHGRLQAVVHATVRFWDLRYFADPRDAVRDASSPFRPDRVVINGATAEREMLESGFLREGVVGAEALRFLHLNAFSFSPTPQKGTDSSGLRLLVLGDYSRSGTAKMMRMLEQAAVAFPPGLCCTVKPHPSSPINPAEYPGIAFKLDNAPVGSLIAGHDLAFCSNKSGAAIDAYLAGLITLVMLDDCDLNLSPLRGRQDICFVDSSVELVKALLAGYGPMRSETREKIDLFYLDPALPRWTQLLTS